MKASIYRADACAPWSVEMGFTDLTIWWVRLDKRIFFLAYWSLNHSSSSAYCLEISFLHLWMNKASLDQLPLIVSQIRLLLLPSISETTEQDSLWFFHNQRFVCRLACHFSFYMSLCRCRGTGLREAKALEKRSEVFLSKDKTSSSTDKRVPSIILGWFQRHSWIY